VKQQRLNEKQFLIDFDLIPISLEFVDIYIALSIVLV